MVRFAFVARHRLFLITRRVRLRMRVVMRVAASVMMLNVPARRSRFTVRVVRQRQVQWHHQGLQEQAHAHQDSEESLRQGGCWRVMHARTRVEVNSIFDSGSGYP